MSELDNRPERGRRDWRRRRVLVTGASSGIGWDCAHTLLQLGAEVVLSGRRGERLRELAGGCERAHVLPCDLGDAWDREHLLSRAAELVSGPLNGLVHAAGAIWHQPMGEIGESHMRTQIEVDLVAGLRLAEQALTELEDDGSAVFVSSTLAGRPVRTSAVYSACKAGLEAVVRVAALAGAARGLTFNAVAPGIVDTPMIHARVVEPSAIAPMLQDLGKLHALGRVGQPADITHAILHLLEAPWTTGTTLTVDGGLLLRE